MEIDRLDLQPKLLLAFVLVALLVGVTGLVGYLSLGVVDGEAHLIAEDGKDMDRAAEALVAVEQQQAAVFAAQLGHSDAQADFEDATVHFDEQVQGLSRLADELHDQVSDFEVDADGTAETDPSALDPGTDRSVAETDGGRVQPADDEVATRRNE